MKDKERLAQKLQSNAQKVKGDLLGTVASYKKCIEILEGIKRTHKKDGSDFQNVLKNFEMPAGASMYWELVVFNNELRISAYPEKIYLEGYENDPEKVAEMEKTDPSRVIHNWAYVKDGYYKNADEIEEEIKKQIGKYKERLKRAENDLAKFDGEFTELQKIADTFGDFLENLQSDNDYKLTRILKEAL